MGESAFALSRERIPRQAVVQGSSAVVRHVIFDLDGTLIESEQIWRDVRHDFVVETGGQWRTGAQIPMIGMRTNEWAKYMHDDLSVPLAPDAIAERVIERVRQRIVDSVPVLPGAERALQRLASRFELGLATSAATAVAHAVLDATGWKRYFRQVVSADEVGRGKPSPDVYLRALDLLRADPPATVAVEDSANGIRSAHAAAIAVVAIPNREFPPGPEALALASRVLTSLDDLDF